jgi:acyl-CoA reductase-like NAD-dependent aldehyde dehydrogenase
MHQSSCRVPKKGYWCRPTIFTGVSQSSRVVQEEIFGPVLAIQTFRRFDEALTKANNTPYGLSGGILTDKGSKIFKMTQGLRAGIVWANTFNKFDPNFSVLEPTGVVSILSSDDSSLLGLITNIAAAIVGGNTCVVLAPDRYLAEIVEQALLDTSTQLLNHLGGAVGTVLSAFR